MSVQIERLRLGPMQNFVYVLQAEDADGLAVVDPAWEPDVLLALAKERNKPIRDIFLTHHHHDHRNAVSQLLDAHDCRIHVHRSDWPELQGLGWHGQVQLYSGGEQVALSPTAAVTLVHTPGHTPGSQCLLCHPTGSAPALLTGDTLFVDGCGRCDFAGGSAETMFDSLQRVLTALPATTRVLPGHDYAPIPESTLGQQKDTNPYLQLQTQDEFVRYRMRPRT